MASSRDHTPETQPQPSTERRPRPRIETLADLVFGLSLSIGSIALIANPANSSADINNRIFAFAFTFLMLITAWFIYTTDMSVLPTETRWVSFLNVALLIAVALVPFLLNNVAIVNTSLTSSEESALRDYASTLFALDLTAILVILATFAHVISIEEKMLVEPQLAKLFRNGRNRMSILAVLMAITVIPQFWQIKLLGVQLRLIMWYLPLVSYWVGRLLRPSTRTYKLS